MMNNLNCIVYNTVEFTMTDPLSDTEIYNLIEVAQHEGYEITVASGGRIILVPADTVQEATPILSALDLIPDIGLIRHITEYEVTHDDNVVFVEFE